MTCLLLEIGTEEIPASYIEPALKALSSMLLKKLTDARIDHGVAETFGTPKRLAVNITDVSDKQKSLTTEITGPPEKIGFDAYGKPTKAAEKFAEKVGISVNRIKIRQTKKGPYLYAVKREKGRATRTLLKSILPEAVLGIPFPKAMRWSDQPIYFARPIQSLLALWGDRVVSFTLGNIKSNRYTFGHSFMHPDRIKVAGSENYIELLRSAHVLADIKERKKNVELEITKAAEGLGGKVLPDNELVDIVTNLVEYPIATAGKFDPKFLEIPREILITAMREHQKYFAVMDNNDNLMPCFIAVNNTRAKKMPLIAKGHERVLRARLEDARFFYTSDLEMSSEARIEKLKGVLFQARLGTVHEKVLRIQKLAEYITDTVDKGPDLKKEILRAAQLCKADLVSQVVIEFPKLQGVMGRVYASVAGESDTVASAIEEHYRPTFSGGPLPDTLAGAVLGIADKIDSICGCFRIGMIPTGTSDPYALRRQGIGLVQIMLDKGFTFSLQDLIEKSAMLFARKTDQDVKEISGKVYTFLKDRMAHLLAGEGFSKDVIAAIASVSVDHVPNVWNRVRALEKLKKAPDFEPLAVAFKRVVNIIKQAGQSGTVAAGDTEKRVDESLFQDECERALFRAHQDVKNKVANRLDQGDFDQALLDIASLRDSVDAFFDGVMVMTDDVRIRENRLALLKHIAALFGKFADFSKIST